MILFRHPLKQEVYMFTHKKFLIPLILALLFFTGLSMLATKSVDGQTTGQSLSPDETIEKARALTKKGKIEEAVALLEEAIKIHSNNSNLHAYLGVYTGTLAGKTKNPMKAMNYVNKAFSLLDKAVELDSTNTTAYLFRGILSTRVPEFFGKLPTGIKDLETAVSILEKTPASEERDGNLFSAYYNLADAYEKTKDYIKERKVIQKAISTIKDTTTINELKAKLESIPAEVPKNSSILETKESDTSEIAKLKEELRKDPSNLPILFKLGKAYYEKEMFDEAREVLKTYCLFDQSNFEAYKMLSVSAAKLAEKGYDERIAEDTNYRSSLAFEAINYADRAVDLNPNDYEMRLLRGIFGVSFPFFVRKFDQGIEDLQQVLSSNAPESTKAEAMYYLGIANQKKAMKFWREALEKAPNSDIAKEALSAMRPAIVHFDPSDYPKPLVAIDLVIGYADELPPQTAIWVEDEKGNYVKTIYVSGFSGYAKDKQVNLPVWATISKFKGTDGVTGASIDVGHHIFIWDLKDINGKKVTKGTYKIIAESSFWPSMKYQRIEAEIKLGKKPVKKIIEEGDFMPYMEVSYFPK